HLVAFGFEVAAEDIEAQLARLGREAGGTASMEGAASAKVATVTRVTNEARRMKRDNEITPDMFEFKTAFAEALASRVGGSPGYIRNHLGAWGLWPISRIR